MANQVYANNASAVLASGITDSATTITVASGQGASFPTVSGGNWAYITLVDTSGNLEIVKCTSHLPASDTFTCTRGQDGTTARAFSANDLFELRVTKATLDTLRDIMSSTSGSASGLESIGFATSGSGACLYTSSTGPTRKILSNSGSGSYYAMGTSPYVMFKTGISFTENTSAEPGTLVFSMSATSVSCSAPTFTAQAITASNAVTGTRFIPSGSTVPTNGMYLPTTDTIGWSTNSVERMRIDSTGPLLYGTTAWPTTNLGKTNARVLIGNEGVLTLWNETASVGGAATMYLGTKHSTISTGFGGGSIKGGTSSTDYSGFLSLSTYTAAGSLTEALRIDSSGNTLVTSTGGLGYGTGSGGTVTQGTSRTTGVTLNKTNGAITLVSAAGSTSWQSFTLTNNTIAATDTVRVCQKSGTDLYQIHVTAVAAGSCQITFATTGGTTTEQPVFNFSVIKGVTS